MLMVVMVVLRVDKKSFCRQIKDITELIIVQSLECILNLELRK